MTGLRQWEGRRGKRSAKVILLGESGVGKTSIFRRLKDGTFSGETTVTVGGEDQYDWEYREGETAVTLRIHDTASREKKGGLGPSYYHGTSAVVLVYDANQAGTFEYMSDWFEMAKNSATLNAHYFLVGNKNDLRIKVNQEKVDDFIRTINTDREYIREDWFFSVSCKTGDGVKEAFEKIARVINVDPWPPQPEPVIVPHEVKNEKSRRKCCRTA